MAQQILSIRGQVGANPGDTITLDILYSVDDETEVGGFAFELLYDADELEFVEANNNPDIPAAQIPPTAIDATQDDGDPETNNAIFASYGPSDPPNFPDFDANGNPARLYTAEFEVTDAFDGTTLNFERTDNNPEGFDDPDFQSFDVEVNEPPEFDEDAFNFAIDENVDGNIAAGEVVGTVTATDPNNDPLTFAIAAGNDDIDGDGELAFDINDQGEILVNDPDDLDFEEQEQFTLDLTVADPSGGEDEATATIDINDIQEGGILELEDADQNLFRVNGSEDDPAELRHTLEGQLESDLVEVGLVLLDEGQTTQDALEDGANIRSIFSVLPNEDENSGEEVNFPEGLELSRILSADSARVGYILNNNDNRQTIDEIVDEDNLDALEVGGFNTNDLGDGSFTLSSDGLSFTVEAAQEEDIPLGAGDAQSQQGLEAFDLSDVPDDQTVTANLSFNVISEADFDNAVGFYAVDDASGIVNGVAPGEDGYLDEVLGAALQNADEDDVILQRDTQVGDVNVQLEGGQIIVPFLLPDVGDIDELPDEAAGESILGVQSGSDVFTPFAAANPEGADHFRLLGDNIFGVEDLRGGGDQDFNDFVFGAEFAAA